MVETVFKSNGVLAANFGAIVAGVSTPFSPSIVLVEGAHNPHTRVAGM